MTSGDTEGPSEDVFGVSHFDDVLLQFNNKVRFYQNKNIDLVPEIKCNLI